jgi:enoyl-[acyl-carrier protein] reductase/trans-2-enoyl-CoA reductase (NAD+)
MTRDLSKVADMAGFRSDFLHLFGFGFDAVNYEADVKIELPIPSIKED